jgi:hypothetical protein
MLIIKQGGKYFLPATNATPAIELFRYKEDEEDFIIKLP